MPDQDTAPHGQADAAGATGDSSQPAGNATASNGSGERSFSQREVDEIVGKARAMARRQSEQSVAQLSKQFGFRDPTHMQAVQAKLSEKNWTPEAWDEFVAAGEAGGEPDRSEAEQNRVRALERKMAELENVARTAQSRADRVELERIVQRAARDATHPEVLAPFVMSKLRYSDGQAIVVGPDGQPTGQTLEELLAEVLTEYPGMRKSTVVATGSGSAGFNRGPANAAQVNGNVLDLSTSAKRVAAAMRNIPPETKKALLR